MRSAFAAFLLCWSVQDASALQRPKDMDLAEIREQLNVANDKTLDRAQRNDAREKALWLTIRAYDILTFQYGGLVFPTRVSVLRSPQNGKKISFIPVVVGAGDYALQNEIGHSRGTVKLGVDESGNFASDGVARIFPSAFANPSALASTILHELEHFHQATTPGVGDVLTPGESEVKIYDAQLADTESGFFPFTDVELDAETAYLKKNLKKRRAQAAKERAQVNRSGGLPVDAYSVASLPADAIKALADKARRQVQIAQADHDQRLRNELARLAFASCRSPGSVFQSALDDLPEHHSPFFANDGQPPANLGECGPAYYYLLNGGKDSSELARRASPRVVPVTPVATPVPFVPAQPMPAPIRAVPVVAKVPFSASLGTLRGVATAACATDAVLPLDENVASPRYPYYFNPAYDEQVYQQQAIGLDACSAALFRRLFEVISRNEGRIDAQWVHDSAAVYRAAAAPRPPVYYDPCPAGHGNAYCP